MLKHRHLVSFLITLLLYSTLFATYFYFSHPTVLRDQKAQDVTVQLNLTEFIPKMVPLVKEEVLVKEEPVKEEPVKEEPVEEEVTESEPQSKPEPKPIVKEPLPSKELLSPLVSKVVPLPPVKKEKVVHKKKRKIKKITKKRVKKRHHTQKSTKRRSLQNRHRGMKKQGSAHASTQQKNRFLAKIRQRINRHKSYPKIARRRGMQGSVNVRFTILPNGNIGAISLRGSKVFYSSARHAIQNSFPISTANIPFALPKTVTLTLRYQLR